MEKETAILYTASAAPLTDGTLLSCLFKRLPEERRLKTERYLRFEDRRLSVAAGALLLLALKEQGVSSPVFTEGENGKPLLENAPDVHFNLSHSGEHVLCLVSSSPCGCDTEKKKEGSLSVAKRFFTAEENAYLDAAPEQERDERFFRLWTLKEAYVKAAGTGLYTPFDSFSLVPPGRDTFEKEILGKNCRFFMPQTEEGYASAVCLTGGEKALELRPVVWETEGGTL